jgi:hypothetical protein
MTAKTTITAAAVVLAAAIAASPAAADRIPFPARPHSRVVTYDRGDVLVRRLQMTVTRADHRLHAQVRLTARNVGNAALQRELRVGRCISGPLAAPDCPPSLTIHLRLAPGQQRSVTAAVTLRQPPERQDTIEAALVAPGARSAGYFSRTDGELLLTGGAWRGAGAGRAYGVSFGPGDGARRLNFDIPATERDPDRAYIDVKWQGTAAPAQAATTIARYQGANGKEQPLRPEPNRSGPMLFSNRFDFDRRGANAIGLRATAPDGTELFSAALPWPR